MSPDIGQNSDGDMSGYSLMKVNGDDSRTIDDIDMKLGTLIKLDNRNNMTSRKIDDNVMQVNYDEVFIFPNYGQFEEI